MKILSSFTNILTLFTVSNLAIIFYKEDMNEVIPLCPVLSPTFEEFKNF